MLDWSCHRPVVFLSSNSSVEVGLVAKQKNRRWVVPGTIHSAGFAIGSARGIGDRFDYSSPRVS